MTRTLLILAIALGLLGLTCTLATGQPLAPDAAPVASPADKLHDPIATPAAAYDDLQAARKQGWAAGMLAALVMLTAGLARASKRWSALDWFAKNKTAVIVLTGVSATSCAAFNALADGGSWGAVAMAAVGTALALITPTSVEVAPKGN